MKIIISESKFLEVFGDILKNQLENPELVCKIIVDQQYEVPYGYDVKIYFDSKLFKGLGEKQPYVVNSTKRRIAKKFSSMMGREELNFWILFETCSP